jgi:hypothetical protein
MSDLSAALREAGHEDMAAASKKRSWPEGCARPAVTIWPTHS